jgi:uncharacterized protein HemX
MNLMPIPPNLFTSKTHHYFMTLLQADIAPSLTGLSEYGLAGIVIFALGFITHSFIKQQNARNDKLEAFVMNEMKGMNEEMIKVIQNNTSVMNDIKAEQRELREAIQSLQQEIKDISM